jgi:hypothetical protein
MEAVLLIGVQGCGKSTFYKERFFDTHVRISRDMLKTKGRERLLLGACLAAKQPFVLDNTNALASQRADSASSGATSAAESERLSGATAAAPPGAPCPSPGCSPRSRGCRRRRGRRGSTKSAL